MSEHIRKTRSIRTCATRAEGTRRCAAVPLIQGTRPSCIIGVGWRRVGPAIFRISDLARRHDPRWIRFEIACIDGHCSDFGYVGEISPVGAVSLGKIEINRGNEERQSRGTSSRFYKERIWINPDRSRVANVHPRDANKIPSDRNRDRAIS